MSWGLLQHLIVDYRTRHDIGYFVGFGLCFLLYYLSYVHHYLSTLTLLLNVVAVSATIYCAYRFSATKPLASKCGSKNEIATKIIESSPSEGTDEENDMLSKGDDKLIAKGSGVKFIKDSFTGKVKVVRLNRNEGGSDSQPDSQIRVRTLGPRLCGACTCDKRLVRLIGASKESKGRKKSIAAFDVESVSNEAKVDCETSTISIATHCRFCEVCVIDVDHHCSFLG
jgi:hypothetical protein